MGTPEEEPDLTEVFEELSEKFYNLRQHRMRQTNLSIMFADDPGDDPIMAMMNTLADLANLCDMQFIRLVALQASINEQVANKETEAEPRATMGLKSFRRSSDQWKDSGS